jgi:hypothetical protein
MYPMTSSVHDSHSIYQKVGHIEDASLLELKVVLYWVQQLVVGCPTNQLSLKQRNSLIVKSTTCRIKGEAVAFA